MILTGGISVDSVRNKGLRPCNIDIVGSFLLASGDHLLFHPTHGNPVSNVPAVFPALSNKSTAKPILPPMWNRNNRPKRSLLPKMRQATNIAFY